MNTYRRNLFEDGIKNFWNSLVHNRKFDRGAAWGAMIVGALLAFEIFNFSTTQYALHDMLGDLRFAGMRWSTVLAIAFCGIDFAGIARIFTPKQGQDEPAEMYYLFGAWLLAAGFNATLTWWGVSVAISTNGNLQSSAVMSADTLVTVVPIFIAFMVWLVRLLIIGTFSLAGDRLFTTAEISPQHSRQDPSTRSSYGSTQARSASSTQAQSQRTALYQPIHPPQVRPAAEINRPSNASSGYRPAPKPVTSVQSTFVPPEPTYHPVSFEARKTDGADRRFDA